MRDRDPLSLSSLGEFEDSGGEAVSYWDQRHFDENKQQKDQGLAHRIIIIDR